MARYHITGGAVQTTVSGSVASSGAVTITIDDATGWPDASVGPYAVVIDPGESVEEVVFVTARTGTSLTVTSGNRGADGTTAAAHSNGAVIYPCIAATYVDEANAHQNSTSVHLGSGTVQTAHFAAGAVDAAALGTNAVTTVKITDANVTAAKLASGAVTEAKIDTGAVTTTKLGALAVDAAAIAANAVTTAKILDSNVTTAKIADGAVTEAKRAAAIEVRLAASQTISATTLSTIAWDTENADASGFIVANGSNVTLTVPSGCGGMYVIGIVATAFGTGHAVSFNGSGLYTRTSGPPPIVSGSSSYPTLGFPIRLADGAAMSFSVYNGDSTSRSFEVELTMVRICA